MAITVPIVSTWEPRGLEKAVRDIQKAEGGLAKAGAAAKALQGPALAVGGALAAGAAVSVKAASDLEQAFGGLDAVFGKNSNAAQEWAKQQSAIGLSADAAAQSASYLGSTLIKAGQDPVSALKNVDALIRAGADSVAVYGGSVQDYADSVSAAYRGEYDALEKYNIKLKQSLVNEETARLLKGEMAGATEAAAQAQAVQNLILADAANVQGAAAAEADSLQSVQAQLNAELKNVSAELGTALLPYMADFVAVLRQAVKWVKDNQRTVKVFIVALASLSAAIIAVNVGMKLWRVATITFTAAQWLLNAALTANPIGLVIAAIVALVAALVLAYRKSETFRNVVDSVFRFLKSVVVGYINIYVNAVKKIWEWFQKIISIAGALKDKISGLFGGLKVPSFLRGALGVSVAPAPSAFSARTARTPAVARNVTINIMGTGDPIRTGATIKRMLETNDIAQGRPRGMPLALSW